MKRESLFSEVAAFFRPDRLEPLSRDDDKDSALKPLDTVGDRVEGEETLEIVFLLLLLAVLSSDEEVIFFEEEEADNAGFTVGFLTVFCILVSDAVDVLKLRPTLETGTDFLVSERFARVVGFVATEGSELLLISGRDRPTDSVAKVVLDFLPAIAQKLFCCLALEADDFSGKPPVLFLLVTATEFDVRNEEDIVDLAKPAVNSDPFLVSLLFLVKLAGIDTFDSAVSIDFPNLLSVFTLPGGLPGRWFSKFKGFTTGSSSGCASGSSIFSYNASSSKSETNLPLIP